MKEKGLNESIVNIITGRAKLQERTVGELKKYGIEQIDSATIDFSTGEVELEVFSIVCDD